MSPKIKTLRLDDVASFMGGGTPSRNHSQYFGGGIPWVKTTDLNNGLVTNTEETLTTLGLKTSSCKLVPERAVLVAMYGGFRQIGRTGILARESAINQALTAVLPDTNKLLPEFLLEWLNFRVDYWKRFAASSRKDPNITKSDVADFPVPEIPVTHQRDACRVLSAWTSAIDKTERLIVAKERELGALKQDLLAGNKRIRGFKGDWRKYRLSDVLLEHGELSSGKEEVFSVSVHKGLVNQVEHLGRSFAAKDTSNSIIWSSPAISSTRRARPANFLMSLQAQTTHNYLQLMLRPEQILRIDFESDCALPLDDCSALDDLVSNADYRFTHNSSQIRDFLA